MMKSFNSLRHNLEAIEFLELFGLGLLLGLMMFLFEPPNQDAAETISMIVAATFSGLFLWSTYMLYIRFARAGGVIVDIGLWVLLATLTASFTFWCWTILDLKRGLLAWLFYEGDTPVEYAWSIASKRQRKEYELVKQVAQQTATQQAQQAAEQPLPPAIEQYVADLSSPSVYIRKAAAQKLGDLAVSHERVVTALLNARETDRHVDVRGAATAALLAPGHAELLRDPVSAPTFSTVQTQLEIKKAKIQAVASQQATDNKPTVIGQAIGWVLIVLGSGSSLLSFMAASQKAAHVGFATYTIYWGFVLFGGLLVVLSRR